MNYKCKICTNSLGNNEIFVVCEMMFGMRESFTYFRCSSCGCLQIIEPPKDISKFYPSENYYSLQTQQDTHHKTTVKNLIKQYLINLYLTPTGTFLLKKVPYIRGIEGSGKHRNVVKLLRQLKKTSPILDVGCGVGILLQEMSFWGFKNLTGIDPFIKEDILYSSGVKIFKQDIFNYAGMYDLIMLHHSFEHMDNPHLILSNLYKMLNPEGFLLIRIPVSDSFAFRKYRSNWFQIDAPRHFFLHTTRSMVLLGKNAGLSLKEIDYDSTVDQFIESENYCRDISWVEYMREASNSFHSRNMKGLEKQVCLLNQMMDGDQACFIFQKIVN